MAERHAALRKFERMISPAKALVKPAKMMRRKDIRAFLEAIAVGNLNPRTELDYDSPFMLLVAVVLSAQTTDAAVNRVGKTLFAAAPDAAAMAALGEAGIAAHIRSIGLWQAKAKNVAALSRLLLERHEGQVPGDREALEALPGVGRKTANVVLNEIFGQAAMAVDTHIFRLGNRTGIAPGATPRAVEDGLMKAVPKDLLRPAHLWLILHGRYVCKARTPECWRCAGAAYCVFSPKTLAPGRKTHKKDPSAKPPTGQVNREASRLGDVGTEVPARPGKT
jgi:endonuclease-3